MKKLPIKALLLALIITSCGGDSTKEVKTEAVKKESTEAAKNAANAAEKEIETKEIVEIQLIAKGESMNEIAFDPASLTIPANSRVKLTLKNESEAAGMFHNFVLVELGSGAEISAAGIKAGKSNNFVPKDDRVIANTIVSKMGETVTVEFDAPAKGSYHYICTYPGHTSMIGRLNVQ